MNASHLRFEHGDMLWFQAGIIFVIHDFYHWQLFDDTWDGTTRLPSPDPPKGFVAPRRGFHHIWAREELWNTTDMLHAEYPPICLGWALKSLANPSGEEISFDGKCVEKNDRWIVTDSDGRELWLDKYTKAWCWVKG